MNGQINTRRTLQQYLLILSDVLKLSFITMTPTKRTNVFPMQGECHLSNFMKKQMAQDEPT